MLEWAPLGSAYLSFPELGWARQVLAGLGCAVLGLAELGWIASVGLEMARLSWPGLG